MNENDQNISGPDINGAPLNKALKMAEVMMHQAGNEIISVSPDSLLEADNGGTQLVLDTVNGAEIVQQGSSVRKEVEAITEEQRQKMILYEKDKAFFEKEVLTRSRSVGTINEDYIKILHPTYRTKFLDAVSRYGTLSAALNILKTKYGVSVRRDVLRRMRSMIPAFDAEIEDALAIYQGSLQIAMHERAVEGIEKAIRDREGNVIDTERVYSDSLLAKMVDTHNPEYKEAKQKDDKRGNTINVQIIKDFHNYKKEQ